MYWFLGVQYNSHVETTVSSQQVLRTTWPSYEKSPAQYLMLFSGTPMASTISSASQLHWRSWRAHCFMSGLICWKTMSCKEFHHKCVARKAALFLHIYMKWVIWRWPATDSRLLRYFDASRGFDVAEVFELFNFFRSTKFGQGFRKRL
jgi:hypothetical protein